MTAPNLSPDQQRAFDAIMGWFGSKEPRLSLGGLAGTGKTTVIGVIGKELHRRQASVAYAAFTGQASLVLKRSLAKNGVHPEFCGTTHSLMYQPAFDETTGEYKGHRRKPRLEYDLIVVDEASMLPENMLEDLLAYNIPVLLVGDHGQLPPVRGRGVMDAPDITLEKIHRQAEDNPVLKLAHAARSGADEHSLARMAAGFNDPRIRVLRASEFDSILEYTVKHPSSMFLTYTNRVRRAFNEASRKYLGLDPQAPVASGEKIVVTNNTRSPVVLANGSRGVVVEAFRKEFWDVCDVDFDGVRARVPFLSCQFNKEKFADFNQVLAAGGPNMADPKTSPPGVYGTLRSWDRGGVLADFGYALTGHKSQGSQAERVVVYLDRTYNERDKWIYTVFTRSTENLWLVLP